MVVRIKLENTELTGLSCEFGRIAHVQAIHWSASRQKTEFWCRLWAGLKAQEESSPTVAATTVDQLGGFLVQRVATCCTTTLQQSVAVVLIREVDVLSASNENQHHHIRNHAHHDHRPNRCNNT
jgi:hypothetical protein